jgi:hypothetical protein
LLVLGKVQLLEFSKEALDLWLLSVEDTRVYHELEALLDVALLRLIEEGDLTFQVPLHCCMRRVDLMN